MKNFRKATSKEILLFQQKYCRNDQTRLSIIKNFKVEVETFEELPPGYGVYGATGGSWLLKDSIIMLKVTDMLAKVCYYPVFSESMGRKLLKAWEIPIPHKMSAFANDSQRSTKIEIHYINNSVRNLMAYVRLYMLPQQRLHEPMAYGFKAIHNQLYMFPQDDVNVSIIKFINDTLKAYQEDESRNRYTNCQTLQDFIEYIRNKYTLLEFKDADFSDLRKRLLKEYPEEKVLF